jgi:hypothetical protein
MLYAGTDGGDDSRCFMAHDQGRNAPARGAIVTVDITAANSAGGYADEDFAGRRRRSGQVGDF